MKAEAAALPRPEAARVETERPHLHVAPVLAHAPSPLMRLFDIAFASVVLLLASPLLLAAMLAIRLESRGPALFRQPRMGKGGRIFELVKLRGMRLNARELYPELYDYARHSADDAKGFYFHNGRDPRVTRVGRVLRKYSIDELPNFWNVLRGDMSIVGPRPEIPELAHMYGDALRVILSVRPGVTSPAKADGRDHLSLEETIERDVEYVRTRSWKLDLQTIGRTIANVVRGDGAS